MDNPVPVGDLEVPATEPYWDYQPGQNGRHRWDFMVLCLLTGTEMGSEKVTNFDKLQEITHQADENLAIFLNHL